MKKKKVRGEKKKRGLLVDQGDLIVSKSTCAFGLLVLDLDIGGTSYVIRGMDLIGIFAVECQAGYKQSTIKILM